MKYWKTASWVFAAAGLTACGAEVVGTAATTGAMQAQQAKQAKQQVQQVGGQLDAAAQQAQAQRQAAEESGK